MNKQQSGKINVPDELRDVLLEFTISYLLEQPPDVVEYAIQFFTKLRDNRQKDGRSSPTGSILSADEDPTIIRTEGRRKSVFAEAYDPSDDSDEGQKVVYPKTDEQRKGLADSVRNILLFRSLDKEQMNDVLDAMFEKKVNKDDFVIKQGDDGDNFYVIEHGIFNAYITTDKGEQKLIHTYEGKGSFGELALLYNMPRAASIKAGTDGALWAMDRQTFRRIVLRSAFRKRKMYENLIDCVPMLKTLQNYERMNLADALIPRTYSDGQCIIKQGDQADGMYFVESGTIQISILGDNNDEVEGKSHSSFDEKRNSFGEHEIKRIVKGGYFGELALVTHKPRAASAYAVGETKLAFLDVEAFERLLGPCMQIMKRNINDYETQLVKIFGSKQNITDVR